LTAPGNSDKVIAQLHLRVVDHTHQGDSAAGRVFQYPEDINDKTALPTRDFMVIKKDDVD